ncbi:hypothetical protein ILYODFUR_015150 [Ilyodon furcidens]|uniref:Uncharacterized protein n=1 Tax=Ilyodon furcidens TaxID=33524 RepID=A0ABV0TK04_9TELE
MHHSDTLREAELEPSQRRSVKPKTTEAWPLGGLAVLLREPPCLGRELLHASQRRSGTNIEDAAETKLWFWNEGENLLSAATCKHSDSAPDETSRGAGFLLDL